MTRHGGLRLAQFPLAFVVVINPVRWTCLTYTITINKICAKSANLVLFRHWWRKGANVAQTGTTGMPDILTIKQVAQYLQVNERMLSKEDV